MHMYIYIYPIHIVFAANGDILIFSCALKSKICERNQFIDLCEWEGGGEGNEGGRGNRQALDLIFYSIINW